MNHFENERRKYKFLWSNENYRSGRSSLFADIVFNIVKQKKGADFNNYSIIDIGCGDCNTMNLLLSHGMKNISGLDIVTDQIDNNWKRLQCIFEYPVWDMPNFLRNFDFTISTDVLEHIPPEMVDESIREIIRITNDTAIHAICTDEDHLHKDVHLSIHSIEWWKDKFDQFNKKGIEVILFDTYKLNDYKND